MTDFGISKEGFVSKDVKTATVCGTPEYFGTHRFARLELCRRLCTHNAHLDCST
jgi:hypothetical protein